MTTPSVTSPREASVPDSGAGDGVRRIALLGNPNTGKTTLFNRLSGLRHKTSNFPGTTQEARVGFTDVGGVEVELIDLPGVYSLELSQSESDVCRRVLAGSLAPGGAGQQAQNVRVCDARGASRNSPARSTLSAS